MRHPGPFSSMPPLRSLLPGVALVATASLPGDPVRAQDARPGPSATGVCFVENRGAWDPAVRFVALGGPTVAWLGDRELTLRLERRPPDDPDTVTGAVVRLTFGEGAAVPDGAPARPVHVLRGRDPDGWSSGAAAFERVRMAGAWPGIDVVFRPDGEAGPRGSLAYDLHVAPRARLGRARIHVAGATIRAETADGGLVLDVPFGDGSVELAQRAPVSWIESPDGPVRVASRLRRIDARTFGFDVPDWRGDERLVVDPGFEWATYLGGGASDSCSAVRAVPGRGIAIAGWAGSSDFPTTVGAFQTTGSRDAFVAMLSDDGSRLLWSTYVGGNGPEEALALDVAPDGSIVVGGWTGSIDFPTTADVVQPWFGWGSLLFQIGDGFVLNLAPDGSSLRWSTYLGRIGDDFVKAVHAAEDGTVIVAGDTTADAFPTTPGALQRTFGSGSLLTPDVFVAKLSPGARSLVWSTYFGAFAQEILEGMAVAQDGAVLVAGLTASLDYVTTEGAYQREVLGSWDGFVARISSDGSRLEMSTLLGGEGHDHVRGVAVDEHGEIWVAGRTSTEFGPFPVSAGAYQIAFGAEEDGYVARLSEDGSTLRATTLIGGDGDDSCEELRLGPDGSVLVVGFTSGQGFPAGTAAAQPTYGGGVHDGFVARFDPSLSFVRSLSFVGGSEKDVLVAVDVLAGDEIVAGGTTFSADLPVSAGAVQQAFAGESDAFALRVLLDDDVADSLVVEDPRSGGADQTLVPGAQVVLAAAELWNPAAFEVDVESVDVVIGGAAGGASCVRRVSFHLDVDRDGRLGPGDQMLSGWIPVVAGEWTARLPIGYRLASRARLPFLVVGETSADCPAGAELLGGVADAVAVAARRVSDGRRVLVTGALPVQGASWIHGERRTFSGDLDGDGSPTCRDVRQLAGHLQETPGGPAEDPDGDGVVTERDVRLLLGRVVGRAPVFRPDPSGAVVAGGVLRLEGYDVPTGPVDATIDGRPLSVALRSVRALALAVPVDVPEGTRRLRVSIEGTVVLDEDVEVR